MQCFPSPEIIKYVRVIYSITVSIIRCPLCMALQSERFHAGLIVCFQKESVFSNFSNNFKINIYLQGYTVSSTVHGAEHLSSTLESIIVPSSNIITLVLDLGCMQATGLIQYTITIHVCYKLLAALRYVCFAI